MTEKCYRCRKEIDFPSEYTLGSALRDSGITYSEEVYGVCEDCYQDFQDRYLTESIGTWIVKPKVTLCSKCGEEGSTSWDYCPYCGSFNIDILTNRQFKQKLKEEQEEEV